jgi:sugar/nucleoside kinase (ribokinase family)
MRQELFIFGLKVVTLGDRGVLVVRRGLDTDPLPLRNASNLRKLSSYSAKHYPVHPFENVVSVVGAGDCFTGAFISGLLNGFDQVTTKLFLNNQTY